MSELYITTISLPEWLVEKYFKNKSLVSVEEIINVIEDLDDDLERVEEQFEDYKKFVNDNYKFIDTREAIGYDERTW